MERCDHDVPCYQKPVHACCSGQQSGFLPLHVPPWGSPRREDLGANMVENSPHATLTCIACLGRLCGFDLCYSCYLCYADRPKPIRNISAQSRLDSSSISRFWQVFSNTSHSHSCMRCARTWEPTALLLVRDSERVVLSQPEACSCIFPQPRVRSEPLEAHSIQDTLVGAQYRCSVA